MGSWDKHKTWTKRLRNVTVVVVQSGHNSFSNMRKYYRAEIALHEPFSSISKFLKFSVFFIFRYLLSKSFEYCTLTLQLLNIVLFHTVPSGSLPFPSQYWQFFEVLQISEIKGNGVIRVSYMIVSNHAESTGFLKDQVIQTQGLQSGAYWPVTIGPM